MALKIGRSLVGLVAVGVLAGCGSTSPSSPSVTPMSSPSASASVSPAAVSSPSATAAAIPRCTQNIRVIVGARQGAAGHLAMVLIFNNAGHTTCRILGYPGLDEVTASGALVVHAKRTLQGMAGGASAVVPVTLAPGASASALVEASDVPQGGTADCGSYSMMVTPPDQFVAVSAGTAMFPKCALEIHPVVAGTHGGMN